ncbi:hypothetical protein HanRHA438_Chr10g0447231 [Helianthus annuus]|uniref:Uncharacterized protein n=1 Tax=Helianthus annuus TaxID=4232 RepID=A0A9K3HWZ4_HELAN|nr:hypothetical protein HanXRQr2_Chr10g0435071 [Helianthus annuus]KAJ0521283.1 hypothetical protein HanIR_Chr10g0469111 [Helianthus annuus]KAJ0879079.1 hypothetical protein HanRHA438_Chr10g0447231 [Helianthus annuus]
MVDNISGEKFLQYPRFIQMILDDKIKNLPKVDIDELELDHMDAETLKRLNVYQGIDEDKEPPYRKQFAGILKPDYVAPHFDRWRHDDSNSDSETEKMKPFYNKRGNFWKKIVEIKKKRATPKVAKSPTPKPAAKRISKKKSPPRLVDEPIDLPPENVDVTVIGEPFLNISVEHAAADAAKIAEAATGGEAQKETFVEGEVHSDSSATVSDIDITQMAPTLFKSGKFTLKGASNKKKKSDEDDVPYVLTEEEAGKSRKSRGMKGVQRLLVLLQESPKLEKL